MPIASPMYRPGGSLKKFGTESYGISGTFCAVAFACAKAGAALMSTARTVDVRHRFIKPPGFTVGGTVYRRRSRFNRLQPAAYDGWRCARGAR